MSALRVALDFARAYGGRITLLHVLEPPALPKISVYPYTVKIGILVSQLGSELSALAHEHIKPEHFDKALVYQGKPFEEIVRAARVLNIDLVIIATHGYTGVTRMVLGSTAERVIRYAPCPVLSVQAGQKQGWPPKGVKSRP